MNSSLDLKTLKIHAIILLAPSVMIVIFGPQFRSDDILTPRSRINSVGVTVDPFGVVYWYNSEVKGRFFRRFASPVE